MALQQLHLIAPQQRGKQSKVCLISSLLQFDPITSGVDTAPFAQSLLCPLLVAPDNADKPACVSSLICGNPIMSYTSSAM